MAIIFLEIIKIMAEILEKLL